MGNVKVFLASDHAGFPAKDLVAQKLKSLNITVEDLGPTNTDRVDYPDFADLVAAQLKQEPGSFGVL